MVASQTRSFDDQDQRADAMHRTIDQWLTELSERTDEARTTEEFQAWLDMQSQFHDYSFRNTLLIKQQHPEARMVAGYRTWQEEFDRQVTEGESAIWIWAPIVTERCPTCHDGESYHERNDCADETPVEEWDRGVVGFKPVPVFDVAQTEGEPLPNLETAAYGNADDLTSRLLTVAEQLGIDAELVAPAAWQHGAAAGVCQEATDPPVVRVKDGANQADVASTLVHEYAHALSHGQPGTSESRAAAEVEAESIAYVVGRRVGLDMANSATYIARWQEEDPPAIRERLERISSTATTIIEALENTE